MACDVQVLEQADFPSVRPIQQDNRAYRLTLMPRALRVLKLADVDIRPLAAAQGNFFGELTACGIPQTALQDMQLLHQAGQRYGNSFAS